MRVVVAPDSFGGTLSAPEAARAIVEGWNRQVPGDVLITAPMADGGPGFVAVLHEALGGELIVDTVPGPYGDPVPVTWLKVGATAYIESAQACGLHLGDRREPLIASTAGVGRVLAAALALAVTLITFFLIVWLPRTQATSPIVRRKSAADGNRS